MKIEIEKTVKEKREIEIELPAFYRDGKDLFYKIYDENHCVQVWCNPNIVSIGKHHAGLAFHNEENLRECTEAEFNNAMNQAILKLKAL
jgi:hypothetical protein